MSLRMYGGAKNLGALGGRFTVLSATMVWWWLVLDELRVRCRGRVWEVFPELRPGAPALWLWGELRYVPGRAAVWMLLDGYGFLLIGGWAILAGIQIPAMRWQSAEAWRTAVLVSVLAVLLATAWLNWSVGPFLQPFDRITPIEQPAPPM